VGVLVKERYGVDPFYFRRTVLGIFTLFLTYFGLFISSDPYSSLGRDVDSFKASTGVFDWVIGRGCQEWSLGRRWTREFVGLSFLGLLRTSPAGLWFFYFGYGWDYLFSGAAMGLLYEISWRIPSSAVGFEAGSALGELFFWNLDMDWTYVFHYEL